MGMCRCPYDEVASFVYRYSKGNREIKILEVGSGDGNNLWYLKKEGFNICGIEISQERIDNARLRLSEDDLNVEIKKGSFTEIDYPDETFDLVIDRGAVTCVNYEDANTAINEINRVLKENGYFYFNPFSEQDGNLFNGTFIEDGRVKLTGNGFDKYEGMNYYSVKDILKMFTKDKWEMIEFNSITKKELIASRNLNTGMFEVVAQKIK